MKNLFNGLTGYYFEDEYFSDVNLIATTTEKLDFDKSDLPTAILDKKVKTVRWIGSVKPSVTGKYALSTDCPNCIIQLDDKLLANSSTQLNTVNLESGKLYKVRIEQSLLNEKSLKDYQGANLYWECDTIQKQIVPKESLLTPDFSDTSENNKFIPDNNFFCTRKNKSVDATIDSDNDGIPDNLEINGYTIIGLKVVKWDDKYAEQGYKKYTSNPYKARTANDPYTDYEKVSGRIDPAISLIARDPMVAAFPVIGVQMEKLVVSKNSTITEQEGTSKSKATSTSSTVTNTIGATASTNLQLVPAPIFSMNLGMSFSKATSSTSGVTDTTGESFTQGLSINTGESAYINPNVRYYNLGTAPVYDVSPNTTIVIKDDSVATIQAKSNVIGGYLNPESYYPKKELAPLAFNTMDVNSTKLIPINYDQLQSIDKGESVILSTAQFEGNFAKIDANGNLVTSGNKWAPYLGNIEVSTSTLVLDAYGQKTKQVQIACRNTKDPTDYTPVITLRDALKRTFDIEEKDGKIFFDGKQLPADKVLRIYIEKSTEDNFVDQLKNETNKSVLNCILKPKMNLLVKICNPEHIEVVSDLEFHKNISTNITKVSGLDNISTDSNGLKFAYLHSAKVGIPKFSKFGKYKLHITFQTPLRNTVNVSLNSLHLGSKTFDRGFYESEFYFDYLSELSNPIFEINCSGTVNVYQIRLSRCI